MDGNEKSHPTRGAWIEIIDTMKMVEPFKSHPTRGAWIEILVVLMIADPTGVAPHTGCVD